MFKNTIVKFVNMNDMVVSFVNFVPKKCKYISVALICLDLNISEYVLKTFGVRCFS